MKRANPKRWLGIGLVVGALIATGMARMLLRERLLMQVARPVVGIDVNSKKVCWLSSHQLLIVTTDTNLPRGVWKGYAETFDTTSHTRSRQTPLTNLLIRTTVDPMGGVGGFEMSPDGTWLRWQAYNGHGAAPPSVRVAHLDGSVYRAWDYDEYTEWFFLKSRYLVHTRDYGANFMVVSDLQDPRKDRKYQTLAQAREALAPYAKQQPFWVTVLRHGDEPSDGFVEIETYRTQDRIQLAPDDEPNEQKSPEPLRTHRMPLPPGAAIKDAQVSPQQQSILYDLRITQQNPLISWLHRLFPKIDSEPTLRQGFWVSRADGGGMREIGEVSLPWSAQDGFGSTFEDTQWLPDAKQISFIYHGMLYIVPAEPGK